MIFLVKVGYILLVFYHERVKRSNFKLFLFIYLHWHSISYDNNGNQNTVQISIITYTILNPDIPVVNTM